MIRIVRIVRIVNSEEVSSGALALRPGFRLVEELGLSELMVQGLGDASAAEVSA